MMKRIKQITAFILMIVISLQICMAGGFAETREGSCGENATWSVDEEGVLTIAGEGKMTEAPWLPYASEIRKIQIGQGITDIRDYAFQYCEHAAEISIPDSVVRIGRYALYFCKELKEIVIPDSVTEMDTGALAQCEALEKVTLSSGLSVIEKMVFYGCPGIKELVFPSGITHINSLPYNLETVVLPDTLKDITDLFPSMYSLKSVRIPGSVTTIPEYAFSSCNALEEIILEEGVKLIGDEIYYNWTGGERHIRVTIPDSVEYIDNLAFDQPEVFTICCHDGSYAQKWAERYGVPVEIIP